MLAASSGRRPRMRGEVARQLTQMADDPAERLAFPFLGETGPAERGLVRVVVTVAFAAAAGLAAALCAATLLLLVAAGLTSADAGGFLAAIGHLAQPSHADRS